MLVVIETYEAYNPSRYSTPWVARVNPRIGKLDFSEEVGGYTGGRKSGTAGQLYVIDPQEYDVYAYGQKDYRAKRPLPYRYIQWRGGRFIPVPRSELLQYLR